MHRTLKQATAKPPALNILQQQGNRPVSTVLTWGAK
jgi:hypothetical protein